MDLLFEEYMSEGDAPEPVDFRKLAAEQREREKAGDALLRSLQDEGPDVMEEFDEGMRLRGALGLRPSDPADPLPTRGVEIFGTPSDIPDRESRLRFAHAAISNAEAAREASGDEAGDGADALAHVVSAWASGNEVALRKFARALV